MDVLQLGAKVTGAVTCGWLVRRAAARRSGEADKLKQAVDAMQTSRRWRILLEIDAGGDWSEFVWNAADAMRDGKRHYPGKGPIKQSLGGGLGCDER